MSVQKHLGSKTVQARRSAGTLPAGSFALDSAQYQAVVSMLTRYLLDLLYSDWQARNGPLVCQPAVFLLQPIHVFHKHLELSCGHYMCSCVKTRHQWFGEQQHRSVKQVSVLVLIANSADKTLHL